MYVVQSGEIEYHMPLSKHHPQESVAVEKVGAFDWLSEAALWTSWWHRGYFTCRSAAWIGLIKPGPFVEIAKVHTIPWNFCRQYAHVFVEHLNRQNPSELSDLGLDNEMIQELVIRACEPELPDSQHTLPMSYATTERTVYSDMDLSQQSVRNGTTGVLKAPEVHVFSDEKPWMSPEDSFQL